MAPWFLSPMGYPVFLASSGRGNRSAQFLGKFYHEDWICPPTSPERIYSSVVNMSPNPPSIFVMFIKDYVW